MVKFSIKLRKTACRMNISMRKAELVDRKECTHLFTCQCENFLVLLQQSRKYLSVSRAHSNAYRRG